MQNALEIAFAHMERAHANRIHRLCLRIGALSGVVPEALRFAFDALKQDTPAAQATLEVEFVPIGLFCPTCDRDFEPADYPAACPTCGNVKTETRRGEELNVVSMELSRQE